MSVCPEGQWYVFVAPTIRQLRSCSAYNQQIWNLTKQLCPVSLLQMKVVILLPYEMTGKARRLKRDTVCLMGFLIQCRHSSNKHMTELSQE